MFKTVMVNGIIETKGVIYIKVETFSREELNKRVELELNKLANNGYEIVNIVAIPEIIKSNLVAGSGEIKTNTSIMIVAKKD
jgi:hypothetical protein